MPVALRRAEQPPKPQGNACSLQGAGMPRETPTHRENRAERGAREWERDALPASRLLRGMALGCSAVAWNVAHNPRQTEQAA